MASSPRTTVAALTSLMCGALAAALITVAPPATAVPDAAGYRPMNFPITTDLTIVPGGRTTIGSPTLPTRAQRITVTVASASSNTGAAFANMYTHLAGLSNRNRLLYCATFGAIGVIQDMQEDLGSGYVGLTLGALRGPMQMCFQIVAQLTAPRAAAPGMRAARKAACPAAILTMPVSTTADGPDPLITSGGAPTAAKKAALRISCRIVGDTMTLKLRPRSKKATLRSVVGERLSLGFSTAAGTTSNTTIQVTYGVPR